MKGSCLCILILISCKKSISVEDAPFGERQSPINLEFGGNHCCLKNLEPLVMFNYASVSTATLTNTGHTAEVHIEVAANKRPGVTGGPLGAPYTLEQYHFHWGKLNKGSEHTINSGQFAMEVHLVHYKSEYGSFTEAAKQSDGFAVVAFFVDVGKKVEDNDFEEFIQHLKDILETNSSTTVEKKPFYEFRDTRRTNGYFTYHGSLTTPPYSENVRWIIFTDHIHSTSKQVAQFRTLLDDGEPILQNWRPIQPTNDREVCYI